jgi:hypothetical protein
VDLFTSKASVVISNVPGVQHPLYLAGAKIEEQFFWVPQAGSIGVGVSVLTYNGQVHFGLIADRNVIPDPHAVVDDFAREFEGLLLSVVAGGEHIAGMPDPIPDAVTRPSHAIKRKTAKRRAKASHVVRKSKKSSVVNKTRQ